MKLNVKADKTKVIILNVNARINAHLSILFSKRLKKKKMVKINLVTHTHTHTHTHTLL